MPKTKLKPSDGNLINHCICRRILKLEDDLLEHWKAGDSHKVKWTAQRIAALWEIFYKIGDFCFTGQLEWEAKDKVEETK